MEQDGAADSVTNTALPQWFACLWFYKTVTAMVVLW